MSKVKSGSERDDNLGNRWASSVSISDNIARQGVELHFNKEPHPELQSKLRVAGFLPSKSQSMWYARATDDTRVFADKLKAEISVVPSGPEMLIHPSYEANKSNIENKRFSFVQISLNNGQEKTYIVFEPSKPRAEVIAANFAYKQFGNTYQALAVNPRTKLREARMLFDEGRIISGIETGERKVHGVVNDAISAQAIKENKTESESERVIIGGEKVNITLILNEFHRWLKDHPEYKGSTKIEKSVLIQWLPEHHPEVNGREAEILWERHRRLVKILHRIGNLDVKMIEVQPYSSIYKKLKQLIPELDEFVRSGKLFAGKSISNGYMDLHVDFMFNDDQGYQIALAHYYKQNGDSVPDPDMRIRVIPETQMAEAMSFQDYRVYQEVYRDENGKSLVNSELKKQLNSFLNQWLSNLLTQGHRVILTAEDDDVSSTTQVSEVRVTNTNSDGSETAGSEKHDDVSQVAEEDVQVDEDSGLDRSAYEGLTKLIPNLATYLTGTKTQGVLKYQLNGEQKELTCFIDPQYKSVFLTEDMNGEPQMESDITVDVESGEARVTAEQLSNYYAEGLGRLDADIEPGDDMAIGRDMTRGLIQWMQDLIEEGLTIHLELPATQEQEPLAFLDEPIFDKGVTGQLEFNPVAVAGFIAENPDLSDDWRHAYDAEEVILQRDFTKTQILRLKEFYNTYILEHEKEEKQYRELLYKLDDPGFKVVTGSAAAEAIPVLMRIYNPEEQKEILLAFNELGFKSPFTVKEAIDRKLPVIDVCFRYYDTEEYFRRNYSEPLTGQIRQLEAESRTKNGKVKNKTEQDKARQNKIAGLSLKLAHAEKTYQDEFLIFQDDFILYVLQRAQAAGYHPSDQVEISKFREFVIESVFDGRTIENYPREPINKIIDELIADFFNPKANSIERRADKRPVVQIVDLIRFGTLAPNVLVPAGTKEPFITGEFNLYDMKEIIKTTFPHLRRITNKTLEKATPMEMWELVQMSHPTDYGVKVDRQAMLEEWEKRGKKMFVDLGLPVDPEYPYVNANLGYEAVEPLNQILFDHNKEGNQWWVVADNWRPIADLQKALVFIDSQIATVQHSMEQKTNAKNGKPHGSQKDQHRQLQFALRDLQEGRNFITNYIEKNKAQHPLTQEPENQEDHNSSIMPVFVNEAIAVPDFKITAPADETSHKRKISEKALVILQQTLHKASSDVLYYQGGAFTLQVDSGVGYLIERPQMELEAVQYFEKKYKASAEYKNREKRRIKDFKEDLKSAEWKGNDYRDEIDRIIINAVVYHRVRLLAKVLEGFKYLFVSDQMHLVNNLHEIYKQRPKLEYQEAFGKADPGIRAIAQAYVKDTIIDNDFISSNANGDRYYAALKGMLLDLSAVITSHLPELPDPKAANMIETGVKPETLKKTQPVAPLAPDENGSGSGTELVDLPVQPKPALKKIQKADQHKFNKQIEALIDDKDKNGASFNPDEKELLRLYAGYGGLLKQGAKGRGVLYEYYTPDWLVEQMWGLARQFGYDGGSVLEPAVGTGNFLKYAPKEAIVFGFETNHYSARIAQVLYPNFHIYEKAFESLFFAGNIHLKDKFDHPLYSLVIGNPPYGEFTGKYAGMGEKKWTGALEYDQYFMLRGLDLLRPGGLMVFLVPSLFIQSSQKYNKIKDKILAKAEVLKCYRLPQNLFAATDIGTDILVLKKRGDVAISEKSTRGIDVEILPIREAAKPMICSATGLRIAKGDKIFYDTEHNISIKALKIVGGDNPGEIAEQNPWLLEIIRELFSNYMAKHGERNELREKYYSEDAIYDPALVVDAALEYIHESMQDARVESCWLHKIDITEAFAD